MQHNSPCCDDLLFAIPGLLDYRAMVSDEEVSCLHIEYLAGVESRNIGEAIRGQLRRQPVIRKALTGGGLLIGDIRQVENFAGNHTMKRTILDLRT